jgi:hypothetical protein
MREAPIEMEPPTTMFDAVAELVQRRQNGGNGFIGTTILVASITRRVGCLLLVSEKQMQSVNSSFLCERIKVVEHPGDSTRRLSVFIIYITSCCLSVCLSICLSVCVSLFPFFKTRENKINGRGKGRNETTSLRKS